MILRQHINKPIPTLDNATTVDNTFRVIRCDPCSLQLASK